MQTRDRRVLWTCFKILSLIIIGAFVLSFAPPQGSSREVKVDSATAPGSIVNVPIELTSQGNENALGFSLTFNNAFLTYQQAVLGSGATGATLNVNSSQASQGRLGIALALSTSQVFPAGTRQILVVTFTVAPSATGSATIGFADQPIARETSDANANALSTTYISGTVSFSGQFSQQIYFAQVAVGGGYSTTFTLINTGSATATGNVILTNQQGDQFLVNLTGSVVSSGSLFPISLPPGAAKTYTATPIDTGDVTKMGWARVESSSGLDGVATFQWYVGGKLNTIVGVLGSHPMEYATIPADNVSSPYRSTGFAVANQSNENIYIKLVTLDENGTLLDTINPVELNPLGPQQHVARFLSDPGYLPTRADFKGSMVLIAQGGKKFVAVALVLCGNLYTAIPVIEAKAANIPN